MQVPTGLAGTTFELFGYRDHSGVDHEPGPGGLNYWGGSLEFPTDSTFRFQVNHDRTDGAMERAGKVLLLDADSGRPIFGLVGPDDRISIRLFNLSLRFSGVLSMSFRGGPADIRGSAWPDPVSGDSIVAAPVSVLSNRQWMDLPQVLFNNSSFSTALVGGQIQLRQGYFSARMDLSNCSHGTTSCWPGVETAVGPYVRAGRTIVVEPDSELPTFGFEHDGVIEFHDLLSGEFDIRVPIED